MKFKEEVRKKFLKNFITDLKERVNDRNITPEDVEEAFKQVKIRAKKLKKEGKDKRKPNTKGNNGLTPRGGMYA